MAMFGPLFNLDMNKIIPEEVRGAGSNSALVVGNGHWQGLTMPELMLPIVFRCKIEIEISTALNNSGLF